MTQHKSFSFAWVGISFLVFVICEGVLGWFVGTYLLGSHVSHNLDFLLKGLCNVGSYFVGGVIVGVISPGVRIHEPALGAFLAVGATLALAVFSPFTFLAFSPVRLLIGGGIAFMLALTGAKIGERLMGNRVG